MIHLAAVQELCYIIGYAKMTIIRKIILCKWTSPYWGAFIPLPSYTHENGDNLHQTNSIIIKLSKDNPLYNSIYNMVFKISHHCLVHANILSCAKTNSITLWLFKYSRTPINLGSIDVFFIENPKLLARQSRAHSLPHF